LDCELSGLKNDSHLLSDWIVEPIIVTLRTENTLPSVKLAGQVGKEKKQHFRRVRQR